MIDGDMMRYHFPTLVPYPYALYVVYASRHARLAPDATLLPRNRECKEVTHLSHHVKNINIDRAHGPWI